ncbi:high mobility group box domain-containing protein, partial [Umbelopsis sp. PMI_123]
HKEKKDPNAPKQPVSSYLYFCNDRRAKMKEEQPSINPKELVSLLGKEWRALDENAKKQWERKASEDKERYQKQLEAYKSAQD